MIYTEINEMFLSFFTHKEREAGKALCYLILIKQFTAGNITLVKVYVI